MMMDQYGRHHHEQLTRNSYNTVQGPLLDTIEIQFDKNISTEGRDRIKEILSEFATESKFQWMSWPHENLATIGLTADYYKVDKLRVMLEKTPFKMDQLSYFYSARANS